MPAVAAWLAAWLVHLALGALQVAAPASLSLAMLAPAAFALGSAGWTRRVIVLAGFPLSLGLLDQAAAPAWFWLLPALLLLSLYPVQAWRDAPLYPTGARALDGLAARLDLAGSPRILEAGCGLGHGVQALQRQWPLASITGLERSRLLALLARWRCPRASVERADMWRQAWSGYDLVYLFQRPESMSRAWDKALREMRPGSWLVSLEFPIDGVAPRVRIDHPGERAVFAYQLPRRGSGRSA
jgi:hypothetical protein